MATWYVTLMQLHASGLMFTKHVLHTTLFSARSVCRWLIEPPRHPSEVDTTISRYRPHAEAGSGHAGSISPLGVSPCPRHPVNSQGGTVRGWLFMTMC